MKIVKIDTICPLPPMLSVPGVVWRIGIGLFSGLAIHSGISELRRGGKEA